MPIRQHRKQARAIVDSGTGHTYAEALEIVVSSMAGELSRWDATFPSEHDHLPINTASTVFGWVCDWHPPTSIVIGRRKSYRSSLPRLEALQRARDWVQAIPGVERDDDPRWDQLDLCIDAAIIWHITA